MLLVTLSFLRIVFTIFHFYFIYSFVNSIPPGRKMVTSDVSVLAHFFSDLGLSFSLRSKKILEVLLFILAILSMSIEFFLYSTCGFLPQNLIFCFTQFYLTSVTLFVATLNVSSLLQVAIITNLRLSLI